ncbi:MAG: hypothetical protein Q7S85_02590 [Rugosibacter sp.]|nr:hypothetical protein [Rugosibacter sp.]
MLLSAFFRHAILVLGLCLSLAASAGDGVQLPVSLEDSSGRHVRIGTLTMTPVAGGWSYRLDMNRSHFEERFLSMRPFICLEGPVYSLCHLSYPYPLERRITKTDLVDLEYDLLFIQKRTAEYGIDAHKGVYYRLTWNNDRIEGRVYETDLDKLAVPPEAGVKRPIAAQDLYEADAGRHAWPKIVIGD